MSIGRLLAAVLTTAALFLAFSPAATEVSPAYARMLTTEPGVPVAGKDEPIMLSALGDGAHTPGPLEAGPPAQLSARQHRLLFLGFTLPWISATVAVMLAALFAIMRRRRPQLTLTLLTASALSWAIFGVSRTFDFAFAEWRHLTQAISYLTVGLYVCTTTAALMRLAGRKNRRDYWLLSVLALAGPLALTIYGRGARSGIDSVWLAALIVVPTGMFLYSIFDRLRAGARVNHGIAFAVAITLGAACHDYVVLQGGLPASGFQALDVAAPLLLLAIAFPLVDRFLRALRDTESARAKLEARVHEREQMLKRNFEQLRQDERIQAVQAERQRIMQDMHDGLGSQLLSSLMLVDRGALSQAQVAQVLRECIDDMRLAIDTLTQQDADFLAAIGNLRYRLEPRFRAAGMQLKWNMRELPDELPIDHAAILPILRILQEALTNTMKHSQAATVTVDMKVDIGGDDPRLIVRVADDGVGTLGERPGSRGLANMRNRAAGIGADLQIKASPGAGTEVRLSYEIKGPLPDGTNSSSDSNLDTDVATEHFRVK